MDPRPHLGELVAEIIARLSQVSTARDRAINSSRQIVRFSANAIRALHRNEDPGDALDTARMLLAEVIKETAPYPNVYWAGYVQDAMKEYAEAVITRALLFEKLIPSAEDIGVEDTAWLNGLAEAASELRRNTLDALRADDTARAESLLAMMDQVYGVLVTIDFPEAMTGGLRRTTDQFRAVLERTRGDVTMSVRQSRLEQALRKAENGR